MKHFALNLLIAAIWLLLQDHRPTFATFVIGYLIGFGLILLFREALDSRDYTRRVAAVVSFAGVFIHAFAVASIGLLRVVLVTPRAQLSPRFILYNVDGLRPTEIVVLSYLINLTPGSSVVAIARDHRTLLLHILDTRNPDAVRDEIDTTLRRALLAITR